MSKDLASERKRLQGRFQEVVIGMQMQHYGMNEVIVPIKLTIRHLCNVRNVVRFKIGGPEEIEELDLEQLAVLSDAIETHYAITCPPKPQTSAA